jgi:hypothetical protein
MLVRSQCLFHCTIAEKENKNANKKKISKGNGLDLSIITRLQNPSPRLDQHIRHEPNKQKKNNSYTNERARSLLKTRTGALNAMDGLASSKRRWRETTREEEKL